MSNFSSTLYVNIFLYLNFITSFSCLVRTSYLVTSIVSRNMIINAGLLFLNLISFRFLPLDFFLSSLLSLTLPGRLLSFQCDNCDIPTLKTMTNLNTCSFPSLWQYL
uniref:Uncharacterized protein n=1 Tax=Cacopsylla melanoneura TaxID=428564 RepID=A0A8D8ZEN8_9HEMI